MPGLITSMKMKEYGEIKSDILKFLWSVQKKIFKRQSSYNESIVYVSCAVVEVTRGEGNEKEGPLHTLNL